MRLIDADAFKNYIRSALENMRHLFKDKGELAEIVTEGFCEDIDEQPTIELPQWIPCSKRMPEEHEWLGTKKLGTTISDEVYVTFENEKGERFCKHMTFQNGELSRYDKAFIEAWYKGSKPIAWMSLPEPYNPDEFSNHMNPPED